MWVVVLFVWVDAVLFFLRVPTPFHRLLFKAPMLWVFMGLLVVFPARLMVVGVRDLRSGHRRAGGWINAVGGGMALLAVGLVMGAPMVKRAMEPKVTKNRSTPTAFVPQTGLPVFPGAEGFGTRTPAGRGGRVIAVTTLADSGPGSLREALEQTGARIVIFRVGGTIELETFLFINRPFVTVAGQTAPGGGICLKNAGLVITTHDVLVQHVRIRPGNQGRIVPEDNDAVGILGRHGDVDGARNVVLDHISASWSEDELISTWFGAHDVTLSHSIVSEALNRSRHQKHTHSAGLLIGNASDRISVHHCLFAHNDFRNPLIIDGGTHQVVNNLIYDWGVLPAEIVDNDSNSFLNFVGNVFVPGPSTDPGQHEILINPNRRSTVPKIFVRDNIGPHRAGGGAEDWESVGYGFGNDASAPERFRATAPFDAPVITVVPAQEVMELVLEGAGAVLPRRDAVDRRIVGDVRALGGRIPDSQEETGGYPVLEAGRAPVDTDADGMPDEWERRHGLDPGESGDANGDLDGDGYTNIEEYLHSLSE
jgi:pectate lyase